MTDAEMIAYVRVMRPGTVVGPQQNWLESMQPKLWKMTPMHPLRASISCIAPTSVTSYTRFYSERIRYLQSTLQHQDVDMNSEEGSMEYQDAIDDRARATTTSGAKFSLQEYVIPAQPRKGKVEGTSPDEEMYQVRYWNCL